MKLKRRETPFEREARRHALLGFAERLRQRAAMNERTAAIHPDPAVRVQAEARASAYLLAAYDADREAGA